jgi:hypothetical protein
MLDVVLGTDTDVKLPDKGMLAKLQDDFLV